MGPRNEEFVEGPLPGPSLNLITSVDDWLDNKKKTEGGEGLWRIHDKLYDFTLWSRTHPGGKFWIESTRGTDITEAFESHHIISDTAESLLKDFYRREAKTPRISPITFHDEGLYKRFKNKVLKEKLPTTNEPSLTLFLLSDCLVVAVFLSALLSANNNILWVVASGLFLGMLSAVAHDFLHLKDNWRMYYFNLSLMSSREWRLRHVLSHHQYNNTKSDLETTMWTPIFRFFIKKGSDLLPAFLKEVLNYILYALASHIHFIKRVTDVLLSKKLEFHREDLMGVFLPLFLFLFSKLTLWEVFVIWNIIISIGSFFFCITTLTSNKHLIYNSEKYLNSDESDFGTLQLKNFKEREETLLSQFNPFRKSVLHYFCPNLTSEKLKILLPILEETCQNTGVMSGTETSRFLGGLQDGPPTGHVFFS